MNDDELNAMVAEKVMGWKRVGAGDYTSPYHAPLFDDWENKGSHDRLESPGGEVAFLCDCRGQKGDSLPDYANDIAAAWSLTEEEDKFILRSLEHKWDYWLVWYQRTIDDDAEYVTAPTAPRAICLAALKAVGVEVE